MAAVTVDTSKVAPVFADRAEIITVIAGESIEYGDPVFIQTTTGKLLGSDGAAAAAAKFAGYALSKGGAGQAIDVLKKGHLYGLGLTSLAYGAATYVADGGGTADAAGTVSVQTGVVVPLTDAARTKVLYVEAAWLTGAFAAGS